MILHGSKIDSEWVRAQNGLHVLLPTLLALFAEKHHSIDRSDDNWNWRMNWNCQIKSMWIDRTESYEMNFGKQPKTEIFQWFNADSRMYILRTDFANQISSIKCGKGGLSLPISSQPPLFFSSFLLWPSANRVISVIVLLPTRLPIGLVTLYSILHTPPWLSAQRC